MQAEGTIDKFSSNREREPVAPFLFHADLSPTSGFEEL
jgi:hypothetical protein